VHAAISIQQAGPSLFAAMIDNTANVLAAALTPGTLTGAWAVELEAMWEPMYGLTFPQMFVAVATATTAYTIGVLEATSSMGIICTNGTLGAAPNLETYVTTDEYVQQILGERVLRARILSDGNLLHQQYSVDGYSWYDRQIRVIPASLTQYGFGVANTGSASPYVKGIITKNKLTALAAQQWTITAMTGNGVPIVVTAVGHTLRPGDMVSIYGSTGNTAANTGTTGSYAAGNFAGAAWVSAVVGNTFTLANSTGNGAWVSGGTVTLVSR
jgi:hypothetical protein